MANVTRGMLIMRSKLYERFDEMQLPWETRYARREVVTQSFSGT